MRRLRVSGPRKRKRDDAFQSQAETGDSVASVTEPAAHREGDKVVGINKAVNQTLGHAEAGIRANGAGKAADWSPVNEAASGLIALTHLPPREGTEDVGAHTTEV